MQQTGHVFIDCHGSGKVLPCKIIQGGRPYKDSNLGEDSARGSIQKKKKSQLSKLFDIKMNYCGI